MGINIVIKRHNDILEAKKTSEYELPHINMG